MSASIAQAVVSLPQSPFPPLAVGFMGLGTGYLIYGPQELFGYPKRDERVDFATGMWGIWMPGFMQFITGIYLFAGLTLFGTLRTPALYMVALAFTAYGVHWFALGWNRLHRADARVNVGVTVAFLLISILGIIVFFSVGDALNRTVLPAFTLIDSPVRGLSPLRALVLRTVKVPNPGKVNLPVFLSSLTMASIRSPVARLAAAPVNSADC